MSSVVSPRMPIAEGIPMRVATNPSVRVRQAVRDNNVPLLARLRHRFDLRNADKNRLTSLSWAAIEGSLEAFEWLLLDYGHDDQELSRDLDNNTVLHLLASVPSPPTHSPHTHLLTSSPLFPPRPSKHSIEDQIAISLRMAHLYHTLFPFLVDWSNSGGKTALHVAAQAGNAAFINLLCDSGADVDLTDLQGNTPLHYASAWGNIDTIRVLLERGCAHNARNYDGFTPSDFAYSNTVMGALQTIARELHEEKKMRRKAEAEGRSRAGSLSTNLSAVSAGSGGGSSSSRGGGAYDPQPPPRKPVRRASEHDTRVNVPDHQAPDIPSMPPPPGRPTKHRSPSLPTTSNAHSSATTIPHPPLAPPLPHLPLGVTLRRADSAQTDTSLSSGSNLALAPPARRTGSNSGRGTPI